MNLAIDYTRHKIGYLISDIPEDAGIRQSTQDNPQILSDTVTFHNTFFEELDFTNRRGVLLRYQERPDRLCSPARNVRKQKRTG